MEVLIQFLSNIEKTALKLSVSTIHVYYWNIPAFSLLTLIDPGISILVKVPTFHLRALDCCLTLKLCVCFQKYKLTSHEKKNWSKSEKVSEILRFQNFMDLRFCHALTHENRHNSLNF